MDISTSTNICAFGPGRKRFPVEKSIRECADAGYRVLDINFCMAMNPDSPMRGTGWKEYIRSIGALAGSYGIRFNQSHLPYYDVDGEKGTEKAAVMETLIRRSIEGTAMLGARWAVTHPFTYAAAVQDVGENQRANMEYYRPLAALAASFGVGIALENDFEYRTGQPVGRVYCASIPELIGLVDAFGDDAHVGICYDFGHANLTAPAFHRRNLNRIGHRLKAVHIQDNHGLSDEHLLPFFGSIDWKQCMLGLRDISFPGDLTFEIQEFGRYLPEDLKHLVPELSLKIGRRLLQLFEDGEEDG